MTFSNYYKDVSKKFMFIAALIFTTLEPLFQFSDIDKRACVALKAQTTIQYKL